MNFYLTLSFLLLFGFSFSASSVEQDNQERLQLISATKTMHRFVTAGLKLDTRNLEDCSLKSLNARYSKSLSDAVNVYSNIFDIDDAPLNLIDAFKSIPVQKVDDFFAYLANRMFTNAIAEEASQKLGVSISKKHFEALQKGLQELQNKFILVSDLPTSVLQELSDKLDLQMQAGDGDLRMMKLLAIHVTSSHLEKVNTECHSNLVSICKVFKKVLSLGRELNQEQNETLMETPAVILEGLVENEGKKALSFYFELFGLPTEGYLNSMKKMPIDRLARFLNYVWNNAFTGAKMDEIHRLLGEFSNYDHLNDLIVVLRNCENLKDYPIELIQNFASSIGEPIDLGNETQILAMKFKMAATLDSSTIQRGLSQ